MVKKIINVPLCLRALLFLTLSLSLSSCLTDVIEDESGELLVQRSFDASFVEKRTRTKLVDGRKVQWKAGDAILYYSSDGGTIRETMVTRDGFTAHLSVQTGAEDGYVAAVYGASGLSSPSSSSVVIEGIVSEEQSGSFDDAHVSVAFTSDFDEGELRFYNLTSLVKFSLHRNDVAYVLFRPAEAVPGHEALVHFNNDTPDIVSLEPQGEPINTIKVFTASGPGDYFFSLFPGIVSGGFDLLFYNSSDQLLGTAESSKDLSLSYNTVLDLGVLDNRIIEGSSNVVKNGLYVGLIGFNSLLYPFPFKRLTEKSISDFNGFIDNLSNAPRQTLLCWTVEQGLRQYASTDFPSNLFNASIITFTDGFDDGSSGKKHREEGISYSDEEYYTAVHEQLSSSSVIGIPISAYSVGLCGKDANTSTSAGRAYFQDKLGDLITSTGRVFMADNMQEVNSAFGKIADEISKTIYLTNLEVITSEPGRDERIRFTFDLKESQTDANSSNLYIEGTFNPNNMSLDDVVYKGMSCPITSVVAEEVLGSEGEPMLLFSFDDIVVPDNHAFDDSYYRRWQYIAKYNYWSPRSETYSGAGWSIRRDVQSAAVLLLLDCSYSLGNDFSELKQCAKSFISKIYQSSIDKLAVASVILNAAKISLDKGETSNLTATVLPTTAADKSVVWTTNNSNIAVVNSDGQVTAVGAGTATITVCTTDGGKKASCVVSVRQEATDIVLSDEAMTLYTGDTVRLKARVRPSTVSNNSVAWSSSSSTVATVDQTGQVIAKKAGTTVISVTTTDGTNLTASCELTVKQHVKGISVQTRPETIDVGQTYQLIAQISPSDASDKRVLWFSSDDSVVSISSQGLLTGHSPGQATITVESVDGGLRSSFDITVIQKVTNIEMNYQSAVLFTGETLQMQAIAVPSNASDPSVTWSSSNTAIATVSTTGLVTAKKAGAASIIATAKDGSGVSSICELTVKQHVTGLAISTTQTSILVAASKQLTATISPASATDKRVSWNSSDEAIVSVTNQGLITGLRQGNATITATSLDGSFQASCDVTVYLSTEPVSLSLAVINLETMTRYYVTSQQIPYLAPEEYAREGLCLGSFIIGLWDQGEQDNSSYSEDNTFTFSEAINAPTKDQAQVIIDNITSINSSLVSFDGSPLIVTQNYWTSSHYSYTTGGGGGSNPGSSVRPPVTVINYYYYQPSGSISSFNDGNKKCRVRSIVANL